MDWREPIHVGSNHLTYHVQQRLRPTLHSFGHIHDEPGIRNFGVIQEAGITFVNCSCRKLRSKLVNQGVVLEIDPKTRTVKYQPT